MEFADPTCARLLLEAGVTQHKISYCLGRALNFGRSPMIHLLLSYGAKPTSGHLKQAITSRHSIDVARALLDAGAPVSRATLRLAVRWGRTTSLPCWSSAAPTCPSSPRPCRAGR